MEFPKSWVFAILRAILALSFRKILEFPLSFWKFLEFWLQKHYILAFLGEIWYINRTYLWYKAKRFPAFSGFLSFFEKNAWVFAKNFLSLSFWALEFLGRRLKKTLDYTYTDLIQSISILRMVLFGVWAYILTIIRTIIRTFVLIIVIWKRTFQWTMAWAYQASTTASEHHTCTRVMGHWCQSAQCPIWPKHSLL